MPPHAPIPARDIDALDSPATALCGRIVTMDERLTVVDPGGIYLARGSVAAVLPAAAPAPAGFESVVPVATGGTIYPGLIELHNHLAYNALRLWPVPRKYANRDQWGRAPDYRKLISGPMKVVGMTPGLLPALIRYVECKCLVAGVTTSQGIELFSNHGARRYYRGIVRNVENTEDAALPDAIAKIADVDAADATKFRTRLGKQSCMLLHLSEGVDQAARSHFLSLELANGEWAITASLAGIHCAALRDADFAILGRLGGAMIWSPLSNLLLYGGTARVDAAKRNGVRIGIGSDWSPSGSKNLLGELKVARLVSEAMGGLFSDAEIVAQATRVAASILRWQEAIGSLEPGMRADLLVIRDTRGDPYAHLIEARETDVALVMIAGVPRFGMPALMTRLGGAGETVSIGGRSRTLNLRQAQGDPVVGALSLAAARKKLKKALSDLPTLARRLEARPAHPNALAAASAPVIWSLALDELEETGMALRPRLAGGGAAGAVGPRLSMPFAATRPLSELLAPLDLDPLTVADDPTWFDRLEQQPNLPPGMAAGLRALYA
ncbi:MAG: amidohydrolase family protein [Gemmatimonadota bacterium]